MWLTYRAQVSKTTTIHIYYIFTDRWIPRKILKGIFIMCEEKAKLFSFCDSKTHSERALVKINVNKGS